MFENEMNLWFHLLIHLDNEVELIWVLSCDSLFFLDRYLKKLMGFFVKEKKIGVDVFVTLEDIMKYIIMLCCCTPIGDLFTSLRGVFIVSRP